MRKPVIGGRVGANPEQYTSSLRRRAMALSRRSAMVAFFNRSTGLPGARPFLLQLRTHEGCVGCGGSHRYQRTRGRLAERLAVRPSRGQPGCKRGFFPSSIPLTSQPNIRPYRPNSPTIGRGHSQRRICPRRTKPGTVQMSARQESLLIFQGLVNQK